VLKEFFQGLSVQCRGHLEGSASRESAVGTEDVAMGIEVEEIAEGLDGDDCPWRGVWVGGGRQEKGLKRIPCTTTQIGKTSSVIKEIPPYDSGRAGTFSELHV